MIRKFMAKSIEKKALNLESFFLDNVLLYGLHFAKSCFAAAGGYMESGDSGDN